jgi:hypothetical protein
MKNQPGCRGTFCFTAFFLSHETAMQELWLYGSNEDDTKRNISQIEGNSKAKALLS